MNLFQNLSFADKLVADWVNSDDEEERITGLWLMARLVIAKSDCISNIDLSNIIDKSIAELNSETYFMQLATRNALKFIGRVSPKVASEILEKISQYKDSDNPEEKEVYDSLKFEFEEVI